MQGSKSEKKIKLKGPQTIERAAALKEELASAVASAETVSVDVSSVEELDLACLQALYAAGAEAKLTGKRLHIEGVLPPRVAKRLSACGFLLANSDRAEGLDSSLVGF